VSREIAYSEVVSDERLRELERRWKETGSIEDEASWLAERLRLGRASKDMVALAAHCGHAAAQRVRGEGAMDAAEWIRSVRGFGGEASVRAILAVGPLSRIVTEARVSLGRTPTSESHASGIERGIGWYAYVCRDDHRSSALKGAREQALAESARDPGLWTATWMMRLLGRCACCWLAVSMPASERMLGEIADRHTYEGAGLEEVRDTMRRELLAWAKTELGA
jgi:hypothetical protein